MIARAIEINPDAHFGREIIQLQIMDWLIDNSGKSKPDPLSEYFHARREELSSDWKIAIQKYIKGLVGLIELGGAWESPDIYNALSDEIDELHTNNNKLAFFVSLRTNELKALGRKPIVDSSSHWSQGSVLFHEEGTIRSEFRRLRIEAVQWSKERTDFMMSRMKKGLHPDTDKHFWDGYVSRPAPKIVYGFFDYIDPTDYIAPLFLIFCSVPIIIWIVLYHKKKRRLKAQGVQT